MASLSASCSLASGVAQATRGSSLGARRSASRGGRQQHRLIATRAEGEGKVVREFNEGDGKISTPDGEKKDEALYADQIPVSKCQRQQIGSGAPQTSGWERCAPNEWRGEECRHALCLFSGGAKMGGLEREPRLGLSTSRDERRSTALLVGAQRSA